MPSIMKGDYAMRICIKCKNPNHREDADFCTNCGFPLNSNYCTNKSCELNNGDPFPLPEDACYCDCCGSESRYFADGLISPKTFN